jgi:hypothetical protein
LGKVPLIWRFFCPQSKKCDKSSLNVSESFS